MLCNQIPSLTAKTLVQPTSNTLPAEWVTLLQLHVLVIVVPLVVPGHDPALHIPLVVDNWCVSGSLILTFTDGAFRLSDVRAVHCLLLFLLPLNEKARAFAINAMEGATLLIHHVEVCLVGEAFSHVLPTEA